MERIEYDMQYMDEMMLLLMKDINKNDKQHIQQLREVIIGILDI